MASPRTPSFSLPTPLPEHGRLLRGIEFKLVNCELHRFLFFVGSTPSRGAVMQHMLLWRTDAGMLVELLQAALSSSTTN